MRVFVAHSKSKQPNYLSFLYNVRNRVNGRMINALASCRPYLTYSVANGSSPLNFYASSITQ